MSMPTYLAMIRMAVLFSSCLATVTATAATGNLLGGTLIGSAGNDGGDFIRAAPNGDIYVAGHIRGQIEIDPSITGYDHTYHSTGHPDDVFIARFNNTFTTLKAFTYVGGDSIDWVKGMTVDRDGNIFIAVYTGSTTVSVSGSGYDTDRTESSTSYIVKFDPTLSTIMGFTYVEGATNASTTAAALAIDSGGNLFIAGHTLDGSFPVTSNAADSVLSDTTQGQGDGFIAKFSNDLQTLSAASFLGGVQYDEIDALAIAPDNTVYVAGKTNSSDFPLTTGNINGFNLFISKLDSELSTLPASVVVSANSQDTIGNLAVDSQGNVFLSGTTSVNPFPNGTTEADNSYNAFIIKLDAGLSAIVANQTLNYSGYDYGYDIAVDNNDRIIFGGMTAATGQNNFPLSDGTWRPSVYSHSVGMVMRWDNALVSSDFSTIVGGSWGADKVSGVATDSQGNIYVTGFTQTQDFPVPEDGYLTTCAGSESTNPCYEAYAFAFDPSVSLTGSDCLFYWAEQNYPSLFAPEGSSSKNIAYFYYRHYSATSSYLGVSYEDRSVYYLGPDGNLLNVGSFGSWLNTSSCG